MDNTFREKDERLFAAVDGLKAGDVTKYNDIYELTYKYLYKIVNDIVQDSYMTEDLLQEAYIRIYEKLNTLQDSHAFYVWAGRIATNLAFRSIQKNRHEVLATADEEGNTDFVFEQASDDMEEFIPENVVMDQEQTRLIGEILDGLSVEQKVSVQYFYFEEMSVNDIAQAMQCSTGTVKSRLNYARQAIKEAVLKLEKKGTKLYSFSAMPIAFIAYRTIAANAQGNIPAMGAKLAGFLSQYAANMASTMQAAGAQSIGSNFIGSQSIGSNFTGSQGIGSMGNLSSIPGNTLSSAGKIPGGQVMQSLQGTGSPINLGGGMGVAGSTGATGVVGATGATGTAGAAGSAGATGTAGAAGSAGAAGTAGAAGSAGATGAAGAAGSAGAAGATGAAGMAGAAAGGIGMKVAVIATATTLLAGGGVGIGVAIHDRNSNDSAVEEEFYGSGTARFFYTESDGIGFEVVASKGVEFYQFNGKYEELDFVASYLGPGPKASAAEIAEFKSEIDEYYSDFGYYLRSDAVYLYGDSVKDCGETEIQYMLSECRNLWPNKEKSDYLTNPDERNAMQKAFSKDAIIVSGRDSYRIEIIVDENTWVDYNKWDDDEEASMTTRVNVYYAGTKQAVGGAKPADGDAIPAPDTEDIAEEEDVLYATGEAAPDTEDTAEEEDVLYATGEVALTWWELQGVVWFELRADRQLGSYRRFMPYWNYNYDRNDFVARYVGDLPKNNTESEPMQGEIRNSQYVEIGNMMRSDAVYLYGDNVRECAETTFGRLMTAYNELWPNRQEYNYLPLNEDERITIQNAFSSDTIIECGPDRYRIKIIIDEDSYVADGYRKADEVNYPVINFSARVDIYHTGP